VAAAPDDPAGEAAGELEELSGEPEYAVELGAVPEPPQAASSRPVQTGPSRLIVAHRSR